MGKGIIKDTDRLSVGSARTFVLKNADVIFLCGARLNWILHFGASPRFNPNVKIIQLDNDPLEFHTNVKAEIPLVGDAKTILGQLAKSVTAPLHSEASQWWKAIEQKCTENQKSNEKLQADTTIPMNYYSSIKLIEDAIQNASKGSGDYMIVSEGSNTMDIGRTILTNDQAKQRLDAGTFGTMGVGFGFAIAAQSLYPKRKVVMVVGDSAFGFSGMEVETAARYGLPLKIVIINNSGITRGVDEITDKTNTSIPVTALLPGSKYDMISQAFGGKGATVNTHAELKAKMQEMLADDNLWILNVLIDKTTGRKEQEFSWLTREDAPPKTTDAKL